MSKETEIRAEGMDASGDWYVIGSGWGKTPRQRYRAIKAKLNRSERWLAARLIERTITERVIEMATRKPEGGE